MNMSMVRPVLGISVAAPTLEGAGVKLRRAFGQAHPALDPFLLFDDFSSSSPEDYLPGFPWHPHRGIETITYMHEGRVAHGDSLGNKGVIGPGQVQWMTAGSGIIHEEMPQRSDNLAGFQLWSNLPASRKMIDPKYRDIRSEDIPTAEISPGVEAKIICGEIDGVKGPVQDVVADPQYLDISMQPGRELKLNVPADHNVFAYVIKGPANFGPSKDAAGPNNLVIFEEGDQVAVTAPVETRFLLISGKPLREPVAWRGPIVMNTEEELDKAFEEYKNGTFLKKQ